MAGTREMVYAGVGKLGSLTSSAQVLENLGRLLRKTLGARWAAVYLYDRNSRTFLHPAGVALAHRDRAVFDLLFSDPRHLPLPAVHRSRRPLPLGAGDLIPPPDPAVARQLSRLALLLVPMVVRTEVTGAILIARSLRGRGELGRGEVAMVQALSSHAGLVIEHTRLLDESLDLAVELARRIDVILSLDDINKALSSSLSRSEIMATAMESLGRMTDATLVALLLEEGGELVVAASRSGNPQAVAAFPPGDRPEPGECAFWRAFHRGETFRKNLTAEGAEGKEEAMLLAAETGLLLAIPLRSHDEVTGVLVLGNTGTDGFDEDITFTAEKIGAQLAVALENAGLYQELKDLFFSTVASLTNAIEAKSPWTKGHSERVMHTAGRIAVALGLSPGAVEQVKIGGLLHDIGKIGIMENLLEKQESLSSAESPAMRLHPAKGVAILSPIDKLRDVLPAILHHHERFDGKGYPDGLAGEQIPLSARIVAVADAFDAMIAARPYKQGMPVAEALRELADCAGTQFDPRVVEAFIGSLRGETRHHPSGATGADRSSAPR